MLLTFYISVYVVLIALAILSPKNRKLNAVMLSALAVLLSLPAYRLEGADRDIYLRAYDDREVIAERSFTLMRDLSARFDLTERTFFLVYASIAISLVLLAIYLFNRRIWWCVLIYYSHWYVLHPMIQMRAACAVGCFLLGIVLRRKWVSIPILVGSLFWHFSAGLGILGYAVSRCKIAPRWIAVGVIGSIVLYVMGMGFGDVASRIPISVVQDGFAKYNALMDASMFMEYRALGVWKCVQITILLILFVKADRIARLAGSQCILKLWAIGLCFGLLLQDYPAMAGRGTEYICSVEMLLMPCAAAAFLRDNGIVPLLGYALVTTGVCVVRAGLFDSMAL